MEETFTIYRITNTKNGKVYIGRTKKTVEHRWKEHMRHALRKNSPYKFHAAIRKHGIAAFNVEGVEHDVPQSLANDTEKNGSNLKIHLNAVII